MAVVGGRETQRNAAVMLASIRATVLRVGEIRCVKKSVISSKEQKS